MYPKLKLWFAHKLIKLVPLRCPFAKYLNGFELCRLNPFYHSLLSIRHRAEMFIEQTDD